MTITDDQARAIAAAVMDLLLPMQGNTIQPHRGLGPCDNGTRDVARRLRAAKITPQLQRELTATIESALRGPGSGKEEG